MCIPALAGIQLGTRPSVAIQPWYVLLALSKLRACSDRGGELFGVVSLRSHNVIWLPWWVPAIFSDPERTYDITHSNLNFCVHYACAPRFNHYMSVQLSAVKKQPVEIWHTRPKLGKYCMEARRDYISIGLYIYVRERRIRSITESAQTIRRWLRYFVREFQDVRYWVRTIYRRDYWRISM